MSNDRLLRNKQEVDGEPNFKVSKYSKNLAASICMSWSERRKSKMRKKI
jgi:hypothetical protein